jgi:hypothetical protein
MVSPATAKKLGIRQQFPVYLSGRGETTTSICDIVADVIEISQVEPR